MYRGIHTYTHPFSHTSTHALSLSLPPIVTRLSLICQTPFICLAKVWVVDIGAVLAIAFTVAPMYKLYRVYSATASAGSELFDVSGGLRVLPIFVSRPFAFLSSSHSRCLFSAVSLFPPCTHTCPSCFHLRPPDLCAFPCSAVKSPALSASFPSLAVFLISPLHVLLFPAVHVGVCPSLPSYVFFASIDCIYCILFCFLGT